MFLKSLSASLVLVGGVVAAVNLHVQDPDLLPVVFGDAQVPVHTTQTEVTSAGLIFRFCSSVLIRGQLKFEPVGELSAVNSDQWTTLRHPLFPKYSARIKQSHFCDTTVK